MRILFVGHVSKDFNIANGKKVLVPGGGVFYGSIAAARLGASTAVLTKCALADRELFKQMEEAGVDVNYLDSDSTTSIENVYTGPNPDERTSRMLSRAAPFRNEDLLSIEADAIHVNPLWYGEFPENLIPLIRERATFLAGDAQGFLRNVEEDGSMVYKDWDKKSEYLRFFDLFKVDAKEARIITGETELKKACEKLHVWGARMVIATHSDGVILFDGSRFYESRFDGWTMEGRTGRGDTCTAAFLVALLHLKKGVSEATEFAARITSEKMKYPGPYSSITTAGM